MIIPMAIEFNWIRRKAELPEISQGKEVFLPAIFVLTEDQKFVIAWFLHPHGDSYTKTMDIAMNAFKESCDAVQSFWDRKKDHAIKDTSMGSGSLSARKENIYASAEVTYLKVWEKFGFQMIGGMREDVPISHFPDVEMAIPIIKKMIEGSQYETHAF